MNRAGLLAFGILAFVAQSVFCQFCGKTTVFNCTNLAAGGLCSSTSKITIGRSNSTFSSTIAIRNITFNKPLLTPRTGSRCWNNLNGQQCCVNACTPNPCLNNGKCAISSKPNEIFTCTCQPGYQGNWCENSTSTTTTTTTTAPTPSCSNCGQNANCVNGRCTCQSGYTGNGTTCTRIRYSCQGITMNQSEFSSNAACGNIPVLTFNFSYEGNVQSSNELCNGSARPVATIHCNMGANQYNKTSLKCVSCNVTLSGFLNIADTQKNLTSAEVERTLSDLSVLTAEKNKSVTNINHTTAYLTSLSNQTQQQKTEISRQTMEDVMTVAGNIIDELSKGVTVPITKNSVDAKPTQTTRDATIRVYTNTVTRVINSFARSLNLSGQSSVKIETAKISLQVVQPPRRVTKMYDNVHVTTSVQQPVETAGGEPQNKTVQMMLPSQIIRHMDEMVLRSTNQTLRLVFIVYADSSAFTLDPRTGPVIESTFRPTSMIPDKTFFPANFSVHHPTPPLPSNQQKQVIRGKRLILHKEYFCVYWDATKWSQDGCFLSNSSVGTQLNYTCTCNHFTSFALLLRVTTRLDNYKTDYYSLVLCGLSAAFLIITVIIYLIFKELRVRRPTPIMVNICLNLALGFIFFLIGMDGRMRGFSNNACYFFAVFMHLAFLWAWFWMLIYSLNMYYALVQVMGSSPLVSKKPFMYVVGYVVPIIIVICDLGASIALDRRPKQIEATSFESHYIASHVCWLRSLSMYIGFAAPIGIILFLNIVIFILVMRKLTCKKTVIQSSKEKTTTTQQVFMAIAMCSTMGLTWIFGYLMLVSDDPSYQKVMEVLFNISNTSQGLIIFFVSCVRQHAIRRLWLNPILRPCGCAEEKKPPTTTLITSDSAAYTASTQVPPPLANREVDTTAL